jgi:hypothetical protein
MPALRTSFPVLFIAIRRCTARAGKRRGRYGVLNANGVAVIRFSLKQDGEP